jgi:hypothetical protein
MRLLDNRRDACPIRSKVAPDGKDPLPDVRQNPEG